MPRVLHLTNGRAIIDKIRALNPRDTIVSWDDVLHEGPVPAGLGTAALRERRVDFLAEGGNSREDVRRDFERRDETLNAALATQPMAISTAAFSGPADEIVLWVEHDLYDQLQLLQILDRVPVDGGPIVTLVQPPTYLGHVPGGDYPALYAGRQRVTSAQRLAARDAWQAFRSADPRVILDALPRASALAHLPAALQRHLEQFPSFFNGLSRTEQQTLAVIQSGARTMADAFVRTQEREEAFFMGDAGFFFHVSSLFNNRDPLLRTTDGLRFNHADARNFDRGVALTQTGEAVLRGDRDRIERCGIDRWLGGVHLRGSGPVWRYDRSAGVLQLR